MPIPKKKLKTSPSKLKLLFIVLFLIIGVFAAIMAVQQSQENRSDARMINEGGGSTATKISESTGSKKTNVPVEGSKKTGTPGTGSSGNQNNKECSPECALDTECPSGFRCAGTGHCNRWCERIPGPATPTPYPKPQPTYGDCNSDPDCISRECVSVASERAICAPPLKDRHDVGGDCNINADCKSNKCRRSLQQGGGVASKCVPWNWVEPPPFCAVASKCPGGECVPTPQGGYCRRDNAHDRLDVIVGTGCKTGADCPLSGICNTTVVDGTEAGFCVPKQQDRLEDGSDCSGRSGHPSNSYCKSGVCTWDNLIQTNRCVPTPTGGSIPSPLKVAGTLLQQAAGLVGNAIDRVLHPLPAPTEIKPSI